MTGAGSQGAAETDEPEGRRGFVAATLGTAFSRTTGFVRLGAMAYALGVTESKLADTYNLANTTPNILYELVLGGVLSSVLIRVYIEVRTKEGQEEAFRFIARLTTAVMVILGLISGLAILAAPLIFDLYTGLSAQSEIQSEAGTFLLRLFVPQLLFYGFSTISTGVLNAHRKFGVPAFVPALNNLVVSASLLFFAWKVPGSMRQLELLSRSHLAILGLGTTAGVVVLGLLPWFWVWRTGFRFNAGGKLSDPRFRRLAKLSAFMLGYVATNQIGLAVAMILANRIQGGVTAYQYAYVFFQLPHGLLAVSVATAMAPRMTEAAVGGELLLLGEALNKGLRRIAFLILPAVAGYIAIAPNLVALLLQHGLTTQASTNFIASVLRVWAIGIFFFSSFYLMLRTFYALGDTKTPMLINLLGFAVNIVMNFILFSALSTPQGKIGGLAVGHSASYAIASGTALWVITRRLGKEAIAPGYSKALAGIVLASAAAGAAAWSIVTSLGPAAIEPSLPAQMGPVAAAVAAGLIVYLVVAKLLRLEELSWVAGMIGGRR